ncbi:MULTISPECIES: TlpA disulfide reductase family protein [Peptoniphilus]|uniref:TlpA disulfide reductase family protein n=1 Tax=Peptoniphilus TaxID=162289 RepID=UPI0001DCA275|nr:TlpA disulfide reductase family protein [Peptoniphilus sp. oral taxon 836]EFK39242.1 antioxidant, AhpC/TSA family [Peptoniphilus sp. oral taxon 836 str. F0141]
MKIKKIVSLALLSMMVFFMVACNKDNSNNNEANVQTKEETRLDKDQEKNMQEKKKELDAKMEEQNKIFEKDKELWDKLFLKADKSKVGENKDMPYEDFLTQLLEENKSDFTDEEVKTLEEGISKIKVLAKDIQRLNNEYQSLQSKKMPDRNAETFPSFTGKDFDGNDVDSTLIENSKFTVMNFWFNGCAPCVGEIGDLNKLNEKLKEKGGQVIGVNTEALDGNKTTIEEAKKILETKGGKYKNIYFDSSSEAGKYALTVTGFPTTIVLDPYGKIMGNPILGPITANDNEKLLMEQINKVLDADSSTPI